MKLFTTFILTIILSVFSIVKADHGHGLTGVLGPILALLQPLLTGLNIGLQAGSVNIGNGLHQVGSALSSVTSGVGTVVSNTAVGLGGTAKSLPATLYKTTQNLQQHSGLVGSVLNTVAGASGHQ